MRAGRRSGPRARDRDGEPENTESPCWLTTLYNANGEADARRVVACWNACEDAGIPTAALETGILVELLRFLGPALGCLEMVDRLNVSELDLLRKAPLFGSRQRAVTRGQEIQGQLAGMESQARPGEPATLQEACEVIGRLQREAHALRSTARYVAECWEARGREEGEVAEAVGLLRAAMAQAQERREG